MAAEKTRRSRAETKAARTRQRRDWKRNQNWRRLLALEILRRWDEPRSDDAVEAIEQIVAGAASLLDRIETAAPRSWILAGAAPGHRATRAAATRSGLQLVPPVMLAAGFSEPRISML